MDKYIIFGSGEPEKTPYEYSVGETIKVNSVDLYKCKSKTIVDGKLIHLFIKGVVSWKF